MQYLDAEPGQFPFVRGTRPNGNWRIREEIEAHNSGDANRTARLAVAAGAEEIAFGRVEINHAGDLEVLLSGLEKIPIHFQQASESFLRLLIERQKPHEVSTDWNPLKNLAFAAEVVTSAPSNMVPFTLDATEFEESGATSVQEVGFTLAAAIDYLAEMQSHRLDIDRAAASVAFSFAIGPNYFFQIAKLRAFRLVWARAVEAFGGARTSARARIHARTSRWNKTLYDPYVNILRGTTEGHVGSHWRSGFHHSRAI